MLGDEIKADLKGDYVAAAGAIAKGQQEADISVIGDKKGGYSQEIIYQPGKFDLGADAQAQAEGQFHGMPYFFGGKGQFGSDASANSGLSMTGFMQVITKDGEGSGNKVDLSTESGHAAGAVAGASGSQAADVLVGTDGGKGRYTETVFVPGKMMAGADAQAQAQGKLGGYGLFGPFGGDLHADADAQSKLNYDSGMLKVVHYGDDVLGDEIKADLKGDYVAAAGAIAKGQQEADISVIGDKKGGYSQEIIYQPGKFDLGADARAQAEGQFHGMPYFFGGKGQFGSDASANSGLSMTPGFMQVITKDGEGSGNKVDISTESDHAAGAVAGASGSQAADLLVQNDGGKGRYTETVFVPGKMMAGADAQAQAQGKLGGYGLFGPFGGDLHADADAQSKLNYDSGMLKVVHYGDDVLGDEIKADLKGDYVAAAGAIAKGQQEADISVIGDKKGGYSQEIIYQPGKFDLGADARAQAEGQFHGMPYFFGGKGQFGSDASANSGLSMTPGFMQVITKDGEGSGNKVDISTESDHAAGAVAGASGSQAADVLVGTDGGKGRYTETVFVPGKMMAGADAQAQAQGKLGGYGLFGPFGGDLHADADAQSKLNYDSGMLKVVHYGDDVLGDEIKADLKGDYVAAAGAIAKGQQEADISVIGDKKGGYSQEIIYQPGKFDLGADAQAQAEGQFHGMPYFFGGKGQFGSDASANSGLSMTPGFMQVITKDGEGSGNKVDISTESDHAAGAVAGASGSQAADVLVGTDGGKGRYTETVFVPMAGADAQAQAQGKLGGYGLFGPFGGDLHADADAQSKLNYDSGMLKVVHYGDDVLGDEIKADLKGDYVAAAGAIAKGQQEADISVIGDKKGGYSQEIIYQPGKFDLGADARAQAEGQFHGMPYFFGGKGQFGSDASANSGLSMTPGFMQVITKDGEGSGNKVDISTESDHAAGAVAGASGSQAADLLVQNDGGKGRYTETVFVPGKMMAGADAQAQAQGKLGGYGLFGPFGGDLHADADAQSKLNYDSGMLKVVHYGDDVLGDEIKADLKGDYVAAAGAIAKGQQEADISVIGDKKGGYSQEIIYQPGKFDLGADARAQAEGQFHGMPYFFGGKGQFGSDASANSGLSMTPGFMQVITKDGEGSGNKVDISTESGHAAGAVAGASGSQAADVLVGTDGGKGRYTETVFVPGKMMAGADAQAQAQGKLGGYGLFGPFGGDLHADADAQSKLNYDSGMLKVVHYGDDVLGDEIKADLKGDYVAAAGAIAKGQQEADISVIGDKKGGYSQEII